MRHAGRALNHVQGGRSILQTKDHVGWCSRQRSTAIYTNGTPHDDRVNPWMGDSRGRWEGDTLVVDVANHNDQTWLDMAGDFHSDALHLVERYTMLDADTVRYDVTIEDPKVFTRPWKISMPLYRQKGMDRILEYSCQGEKEEANGDFEPEPRTWYPGPGAPAPTFPASPQAPRPQPWKRHLGAPHRPTSKPDLNDSSSRTQADQLRPRGPSDGRGGPDAGGPQVVIDPPDGQPSLPAVGAGRTGV